MYGGRFGGAGATGQWGRARSAYPRRSTGFRRGFIRRRNPLVRGGNIHVLSSITVTHATTEETAVYGFLPILHAGYWLDAQMQNADPVEWQFEGELDGTYIKHLQFQLDLFTTTSVTGVKLLIPAYIGLAIVPFYDSGAQVGNPLNWFPNNIPNLFCRDWGRWQNITLNDKVQQQADDVGPRNRGRVLHRHHTMVEASDQAVAGACYRPHTVRLRNFGVPADRELGVLVGAYNTHQETDVLLGYRVAGTFGYIHRRKM